MMQAKLNGLVLLSVAFAFAGFTLDVEAAPAGYSAQADRSVQISSSFGQKGSKICAAWGNGVTDPSLANFKTPHVVGLYDWSVAKPDAADELGFDYWPMLWGGDSAMIAAFESAVTEGFGTIILGFNEPNEEGQSNLDPLTAAALWTQYIEPKRSLGYKTCSPAMSTRSNGQQWMQQFLQACSGCTVDYQCLHWYDIGFDNLQIYLEDYHNQFGLPILLTEFADQNFNSGTQPTQSDVIAFMEQALAYFDDTDWILAACPFDIMRPVQGVPSGPSALQNADGTPTELGLIVINDEY